MENTDKSDNIIAYLTGELDEIKSEAMKNDKKMQKQLDDYTNLWDKSEMLGDFEKIDVDNDWKKVRSRMGFEQKSKKIPFRKYMLRISAILIMAFAMAYLFNALVNQVPETVQIDYYSELAGDDNKIVELPDGSVVTINKGGSLYYNNNFSTDNRDVILEGEAFFEVSRNENLPFKVFASNSTIEVLGTSFNVKTQDEKVELNVVTGKVAFFETANKTNRIELLKNEMIAYNKDAQAFTEKAELNQNDLAWRTGILEFRDTPLDEVFTSIANYFNLTLDLPQANHYLDVTYTGSFDHHSLEDIIYSIEQATEHPLLITIKKDKIIIGE